MVVIKNESKFFARREKTKGMFSDWRGREREKGRKVIKWKHEFHKTTWETGSTHHSEWRRQRRCPQAYSGHQIYITYYYFVRATRIAIINPLMWIIAWYSRFLFHPFPHVFIFDDDRFCIFVAVSIIFVGFKIFLRNRLCIFRGNSI